ncbi:MAG: hypothetical protein ABI165_08035 [Bryobacteraceae bacterium]
MANPPYPAADPSSAAVAGSTAIWRIDSNLNFSRIYQASATLERQLPGGFVLVSDYTYQRGDRLYRGPNINAPFPDSGRRPYFGAGFIDQIESSASSRANLPNWTLRSPAKRRFQFFAQYTLAWQYNDTGGAFPPPPGGASVSGLFSSILPANNCDLQPEWAARTTTRVTGLESPGASSCPGI